MSTELKEWKMNVRLEKKSTFESVDNIKVSE